jgi:hypothetical protein
MAVQAVALAFLAIAQGPVLILTATALFAVTIGNSLMIHPLLLVERFGTRNYGRIYATSQMITVVGVAGCPALIGLLYEVNQDYLMPFLVIACITTFGLVTLATVAAPKRARA